MLTTSRLIRAGLSILGLTTLLTACGGGGGGTTTTTSGGTPPSAATTYTAAAMAGELLTYTIDTTALTYSYTITDSQYGLNGKTGSGTLTHNSDGTYSPSGISNAKIAILPNGLLLGAVRESINGTLTTIPIIGMSSPVTTLAAGAGTYNFVQRSRIGASTFSAYGTFQISSAGTWTSCASGNLTGCTDGGSGTLNSLGGGKWQVLDGATNIGTAIVFSSGGQNVVILDLKDTRNPGFGTGILVGSSQQAMNASLTNGTWVFATSTGNWGTMSASGGILTCQTLNGAACSGTTSFTADSPWTGMATAVAGGHGLLAGMGVYAYQNAGGYAEFGVKIN